MFKIIETIGAKTPKALAYFIIVVGFAAVTARILLPLSKLDTDFFSDHLTAFSGRPASIQNVRYSWTGWAPTLTAQKLNILDKPNGTTLIHFPIVRIEVSPIQSLINRELTAEKITFENLCRNLDNVASRTTIQSILNDGVNNNYLSKEIDKNDKRKKYFSCINLKDTLDEWYKNNKSIFN